MRARASSRQHGHAPVRAKTDTPHFAPSRTSPISRQNGHAPVRAQTDTRYFAPRMRAKTTRTRVARRASTPRRACSSSSAWASYPPPSCAHERRTLPTKGTKEAEYKEQNSLTYQQKYIGRSAQNSISHRSTTDTQILSIQHTSKPVTSTLSARIQPKLRNYDLSYLRAPPLPHPPTHAFAATTQTSACNLAPKSSPQSILCVELNASAVPTCMRG
eukprot:1579609-Pleurochrysis_carterae.AAC.2